ncbi:MAG: NeuD/PglB/VioB family sugar acetyltransferase [Candidatus Omnitrophota bacterium]|nr:NeuD/PglB/VioB family sugar acetyltransferase [Candidatus Omnitrophota bacterium]
MREKIILFPFGGNGREALLSILGINAISKRWDPVGFMDDDSRTHGKVCLGLKVLGRPEGTIRKFPDARVLAVPGSARNFLARKAAIDKLGIDERRFATIVHPSVILSPDAKIGYNTLLMPNVVVSCGVTVGNHCIVLPNTVISHDSVLGDYCCVGSNVSISGGVSIGPSCYIGSGTKIRERISIRERTLIGLGANVVSDIESGVVAAGNPARIMRKVEE